MPLTLETMRRNATIDFHFFTDNVPPEELPPNVRFHLGSFEDYIAHANKFLDFEFAPPDGYKLCDLRPLFGIIHADLIGSYDFYGWTDTDILFGDIRAFYTPDILNRYDVLSTHAHTISGHMAIFRNNAKNRLMYRRIYKWQEALQNPEFVGIDEHGIRNAYLYTFWDKAQYKFGLKVPVWFNGLFHHLRQRRIYLEEQYTTPFVARPWLDGTLNSEQPAVWFYKNGRITNARDGNRNFIYLHLMNFKSSRWRHDGTSAPWENGFTYEVETFASPLVIDHKGIRNTA